MKLARFRDRPADGAYPGARALALCCLATLLAVLACVRWIDRPLAWSVMRHGWPSHPLVLALTHIPVYLGALAALILLLTPLRLAWRRPPCHAERVLLAMSVSLALALLLKDMLKVVFGRAWPRTWVAHNLSLIHDHFYAFLWWQTGRGYQSFPSGHTTAAFAMMSVLWLGAPRLRGLAAMVCVLTVVGLGGMDYHFAGDMVGGAVLGSACGVYVWRTARRLAPAHAAEARR